MKAERKTGITTGAWLPNDMAEVHAARSDTITLSVNGRTFLVINGGSRTRGIWSEPTNLTLYGAGCTGSGSIFFSDGANLARSCSQAELLESTPSEPLSATTPVASMVAEIRSALSLRMTELADTMRVERPTVYAWIRDSTPLERNLERLGALHRLAQHWTTQSDAPVGSAIRQPLPGTTTSVVSMLTRETIDFEEVESALERIRQGRFSPEQGGGSPSGEDATPAEIARRRGYAAGSEADQEARIASEARPGYSKP